MSAPQKPQNPAESYESFYVPGIFGPLSKLVLAAAQLRPGEHALDIACGTGIVARQAAPAVGSTGRVAALDLRPGMLAVARSRPAPDGPAIEWHEGDAQALPFADSSFDVVFCQQGLQFFPDREKALREMKRVSRPGARIVLACWRDFALQSFIRTMADVELAHLHDAGMSLEDAMAPFSLGSAEELVRLCAAAGLASIEITPATIDTTFPAENFVFNMEFAYAAVMPHFAENPERFEAYVALVEKETEALRAKHTNSGRISFPMQTHVVSARA